MNLNNDDNCVVNVDEIDRDPNEAAKLKHLLMLQVMKKNIIPHDEFVSKYEVLFKKDRTADITQLQQISAEYMSRIDPYHPVYVVRSMRYSSVEELLQEDNVEVKLPAIWNRIGTVNNLDQTGLDKMQAFNNIAALDLSDPFDKKKIRYSQELAAVFNAMTDPTQLAQNKERAQQMAKEALEKVHQDAPPTPDEQEQMDEMIQQYEEDSAPEPVVTEEFL